MEDDEDAFFLSLLRNDARPVEDLQGPDISTEILDLDTGELFQPCIAWLPSREDPIPTRHQQTGGAIQTEDLFHVSNVRQLAPSSAFAGRLIETPTEYDIQHSLADVTDIVSVAPVIDSFINQLVQPHIAQASDGDYISLAIDSASLNEPLNVSYHRKSSYDPQCFLNAIFKKAQSSGAVFLFDGRLKLTVSVLKQYSGTGRGKRNLSEKCESFFGRKRDLVEIKNSDHRCGYLAITLGYLYNRSKKNQFKMTNHTWRVLKKHDSPSLIQHMEHLFRELNIPTREPLDITTLKEIQTRLPEFQFILIERPTPSQIISKTYKPLFCGQERPEHIILEYTRKPGGRAHYNFIKKLSGYFNKDKWCYNCMAPTREHHLCPDSCKQCRSRHSVSDEPMTRCLSCNNDFSKGDCFDAHKKNGTCMRYHKCEQCAIVFLTKEEHHCDSFKCLKCSKVYSSSPHLCFMQKPDKAKIEKEDSQNKVIVAFDIETRIVTDAENRSIHVANLVISHTVCDICYHRENEQPKLETCEICGVFENVFFGDDCIKDFVSYLMDDLQIKTKDIKRIFVFAHNFKGYDGKFILRELIKQKYMNMSTVLNGTKVTKIDVGKVRFLDSLSFFLLPLSQLPKAFAFPYTIAKGTFPHSFNRPENYAYAGPYPAVSFYEAHLMKPKQLHEFMEWYETTSGKQFNFMNELITYCRTDVKILLYAVQEFRLLFRQVTGIDPFTRSFTLASVALETFRTLHLAEETIGLMPPEGYFSKRNGSIEATAWLDHLQKQQGIAIEREQRIGRYWADGIHRPSRTIYEYYGCFFHGCPVCYPNRDLMQLKSNKTMGKLYEETVEKEQYYRSRGFNLVSVWSCCLKERDPSLTYFRYRKAQLTVMREKTCRPLREMLCGGRTENFKLMHECEDNEQLRYLDFTSLYPFVLKQKRFPLKHPVVITEDLDVSTFRSKGFFGVVYCKILPPAEMLIPLLGIKSDKKLVFGLCRRCIETQSPTCSHTESERALDSCWTTEEIYAAMDNGYTLLQIYAVLHYEEQSDDLFKPYIDMFLKIKQERSGLPADVTNVDDYVRAYMEHEQILLDPDSIERNEGLRLIAKLLLNSLWGKFVQRPNLPRTEIINDANTLTLLVTDPAIEVKSTIIINEDTVLVTWKYRNEEDVPATNTCPVIAMFVTAYARLELFYLILKIESVRKGRVAYVDTDSCIFSEKEGDPPIPCGNYLGELTDELEGSICKKGYFAAPKVYALVHETPQGPKTLLKMKGLSLNSSTESFVNVDVIGKLITEQAENPWKKCENRKVAVPQTEFRTTNKADLQIFTHKYDKLFRVTCEKRISHNFQTYPFGYFRN